MVHLADTALAAALAQIEADGRAYVAHRDRVNADPRMIALKAKISTQLLSDGTAGGLQLFGYLGSADNVQDVRIRALMNARRHQLSGYRVPAQVELGRAARLRREWHRRTHPATVVASLMAVDRIAAGVA